MRILLGLLLTILFVSADAQSSDPVLDNRLNEYMQLNRQHKFRELMEYIHPAMFKIMPKENIIEAFEKGFENEDVSMKIDSATVTGIGPVFTHATSNYHKVDYFMVMTMRFKDNAIFADTSFTAFMTSNLQKSFPSKKVELDLANATYKISGNDTLIAIRDPNQPWMFIAYDKSKNKVLKTLFPKEVINHFGLEN